MSHFVLFHWITIQIFIVHTASEAVVRGVIGQPVQLPCFYQVSRQKDISDMCWGRGPCPNSKCSNKILHTTGNRVTFRKSQRYSLRGYISYGDVSLTIGKVKAEDAGTYCCRVEIPGWFNDIKRNMRLEVVRAPPVMTTTTRKAPVSPKRFRKTTLAPQATSDHQTTAETAVLLTTTVPEATTATTDNQATAETAVLLTTTVPEATTATSDHQTTAETAVLLTTTVPEATTATTESPAVITLETVAPPTFAVTENYTIPATVVTTSALPDFPTGFQEADMRTEDDDVFCTAESVPLPGGTKVTTKLPSTLPTAEGTKSAHTSLMVEDVPTAATTPPAATTLQTPERTLAPSASSDGNAEKHDVNRDKFPSYAIIIACLLVVSILFILMLSLLFWKRLCHHEETREHELVGMQQEEACAKNLFTHLLQPWTSGRP
ncbi:T-cell immunoglobulin and mucin domain-containing protein 4-like isoform X1 [Aquila chrysaetos chrysaetos]|uniref:T-cell immunoglobulin and mucin domain-containing protein 4-like isoform X1 n=1 Tax=Aquila chrysaetos chrysaetos TaxID=223781 RepID=UPI0011772EE6|nr:T-cell immunoglobulin and mucin domain-containing protein 4-like isoform X1 [Aquila chrysaetos chrysaetos]